MFRKEYVIPVAFSLNDYSERGAAEHLAEILSQAINLWNETYDENPIEEWWLPNHKRADGNDREAILVFIDCEPTEEAVRAKEKEFYTQTGHPDWADQEEYNRNLENLLKNIRGKKDATSY